MNKLEKNSNLYNFATTNLIEDKGYDLTFNDLDDKAIDALEQRFYKILPDIKIKFTDHALKRIEQRLFELDAVKDCKNFIKSSLIKEAHHKMNFSYASEQKNINYV